MTIRQYFIAMFAMAVAVLALAIVLALTFGAGKHQVGNPGYHCQPIVVGKVLS